MKKTLSILLYVLLSMQIFSTEEKYIIDDVQYNIQGPTRPYFLERKLGIKKGASFNTLDEVEAYRANIEQELHNLRLYEDLSVTTEIDNKSVLLTINLDEAWGIVPVPYVKWGTGTGGKIATKLYWNNSLGTLTNTLFQGGVNIGQNPDGDLELQMWDFTTRVSDILIRDRYYSLSVSEKLENEKKDDEKWEFYSTELSLGTSFNPVKNFQYSPEISVKFNYLYDDVYETINEEDIPKKPVRISYSHGFGKSNINWIGNFRNGFSYSIGNEVAILLDGDVTPATSFNISGTYFKTFGNLPLSIGSRLSGITSINEELLGLDSNIRGIQDGKMYGYNGAFFNNNIYVRVIKLQGIAEAIFAPSFDIGITDKSGIDYGVGADFILYVDKLKSLVARGTIAWDPREDFEPLSLDTYEIIITSSLFF